MTKEKKHKPVLRPLERSGYIYFFPLLFTLIFMWFAGYWEQYYQTAFPFWAYLLLIPLALLGIVIGVQLQIYLRRTMGRKAERFISLLLMAILALAMFAEYQYVLAPQFGAPPLSLHLILEALRRKLPFSGS